MKFESRIVRIMLISIVTVASLAFATGCIWRLQIHPSAGRGGDALGYHLYAFAFAADGLSADFGSVRTYGYPLFLSVFARVLGRNDAELAMFSGIFQYGIFFAASTWLFLLISKIRPLIAAAILIAFLLNPYIISLVTDSISEGLAIPLTVLSICIAVTADQSQSRLRFLLLCAAGAVLVAFTFMVRPASVTLIVAWHFAVIFALYRRTGFSKAFVSLFMIYSIVATVVTAIVFVPQSVYNWRTWGSASFFPVCDISNIQFLYGIAGLRYEAFVLDDVLSPFTFLNPAFNGEILRLSPASWYSHHVAAGIFTVLGHWLLSFDVNTLFTYVYGGYHQYGVLMSFLYYFVFLCGVIALVDILSRKSLSVTAYPLTIPFIVLLTLAVIGTNGIIGVELRFNAVPIMIFSAFGCRFIIGQGFKGRPIVLVLVCCSCVCLTLIADLSRRSGKVISMSEVVPFDVAAARCYTFAKEVPPELRIRP